MAQISCWKERAEGAGRLSHADVSSIGAVAYRLLFANSPAARTADNMFKCKIHALLQAGFSAGWSCMTEESFVKQRETRPTPLFSAPPSPLQQSRPGTAREQIQRVSVSPTHTHTHTPVTCTGRGAALAILTLNRPFLCIIKYLPFVRVY